jgi:hypothetical protein
MSHSRRRVATAAAALFLLTAGSALADDEPVQLHVHARTHDPGQFVARDPVAGWVRACDLPCSTEVVVDRELGVRLGDERSPVRSFQIGRELGPDVDVEVRRPSRAPIIGGISMVSSGSLLAIAGLVMRANVKKDHVLWQLDRDMATGTAIFGAAVLVSGVLWLATHSSEPRVTLSHREP